jgi:hypothetical protein
MAIIVIVAIAVIKTASQAKYDPKPVALSTFIVHLPQKCALRGYMLMGDHLFGQMQIGDTQMRKLWALAKSCGGRIEQLKNPETADIYGPHVAVKSNEPSR